MEVTTAERYASGGPGRDLYAQNLAKAFQRPSSGSRTTRRSSTPRATRRPGTSCATEWRGSRAGLPKLGVGKGDTVALMMNNRPEFFACDLGDRLARRRAVLDLPDLLARADPYVVSDAGAKVAIVETMFLEVFDKAREELPGVEHVIVIDGDGGDSTARDARGERTRTSTSPARSTRSSPTTC